MQARSILLYCTRFTHTAGNSTYNHDLHIACTHIHTVHAHIRITDIIIIINLRYIVLAVRTSQARAHHFQVLALSHRGRRYQRKAGTLNANISALQNESKKPTSSEASRMMVGQTAQA